LGKNKNRRPTKGRAWKGKSLPAGGLAVKEATGRVRNGPWPQKTAKKKTEGPGKELYKLH